MLRLDRVEAGFGAGALRGQLRRGHACVSLMGRNGMGKTTTIRAIMGPAARRVAHPFDRVFEFARAGIGGRQIFTNLSVAECHRGADGGLHWTLDSVLDLFPAWANGWIMPAAICRAASSRCWPSGGR